MSLLAVLISFSTLCWIISFSTCSYTKEMIWNHTFWFGEAPQGFPLGESVIVIRKVETFASVRMIYKQLVHLLKGKTPELLFYIYIFSGNTKFIKEYISNTWSTNIPSLYTANYGEFYRHIWYKIRLWMKFIQRIYKYTHV